MAENVPPFVRGDAVRWGQILTNLGSNAVKFTDTGHVAISIGTARVQGDRTVVETTVSDTGPGIPGEAQQRLFNAFTQADPSTTRRHGGTGLGLTIARQLVDALDGEIDLTSVVGEGTTFRFTATFGASADDAREQHSTVLTRQPAGGPRSRLLVVEDNEVNQMVAVGLLESAGYVADVAVDGVEAVEAVEALADPHGYVAVLMDCRMSRMDGFAATRAIRSQESPGARVPIIAMTASALQGERERCLASGMDDCVTKPVDCERLLSVVQRWIDETAAQAEPAADDADAEPDQLETPEMKGAILDVERIEMLDDLVRDGVSLFERSSCNFATNAPGHLATWPPGRHQRRRGCPRRRAIDGHRS